MQDSMQSPLFRMEILDLLKKAVQEELKPKPDEKVTKSKEGEGGGGESGDKATAAIKAKAAWASKAAVDSLLRP